MTAGPRTYFRGLHHSAQVFSPLARTSPAAAPGDAGSPRAILRASVASNGASVLVAFVQNKVVEHPAKAPFYILAWPCSAP